MKVDRVWIGVGRGWNLVDVAEAPYSKNFVLCLQFRQLCASTL